MSVFEASAALQTLPRTSDLEQLEEAELAAAELEAAHRIKAQEKELQGKKKNEQKNATPDKVGCKRGFLSSPTSKPTKVTIPRSSDATQKRASANIIPAIAWAMSLSADDASPQATDEEAITMRGPSPKESLLDEGSLKVIEEAPALSSLPPDLAAAACSGDMAAVERAIAAGQEVNELLQVGIAGCTALMLAAENGHCELCVRLVKLGADINTANRAERKTALMLAAENGQVGVCVKLVELGADLNSTRDWKQKSALILAAEKGQLKVCVKLVELGAHLHLRDLEGRTVLVAAAERRQTDVCMKLAELAAHIHLAHLNVPDYDGWTVLMLAANFGQLEVCMKLVELGANLNSLDHWGNTALHLACRGKNLEVSNWLVEQMSRETALALNQDGKYALQVWGISLEDHDQNRVVKAKDKEDFRAHVEALFSDVL